ncbi:MAG: hypothetical protein AAF656_00375 [Planctomycetota bacterium]
MPDLLDNLPDLDTNMPSFFEEQEGSGRDLGATLHDDRLLKRTASKRQYLNLLNVANAAKHLSGLPEPGESWHGVMRANFDAFSFVPAIIDLLGCPLSYLGIATLGFNRNNAGRLIGLIDEGQVQACHFVCSVYYRSNEPDVYDDLHAALTVRGQRAAAIRCHAKLLVIKATDGRCLTLESSANLRSCRNLEQFVLTHDASLLDFHRRWIGDVLAQVPAAEGGK